MVAILLIKPPIIPIFVWDVRRVVLVLLLALPSQIVNLQVESLAVSKPVKEFTKLPFITASVHQPLLVLQPVTIESSKPPTSDLTFLANIVVNFRIQFRLNVKNRTMESVDVDKDGLYAVPQFLMLNSSQRLVQAHRYRKDDGKL